MKKTLNKLISKVKNRNKKLDIRITSDTVAEHREQILAGGRKFKYPIQYAKHKLVINAIIISLVALVALVAVGYWQLYRDQNTSEFIYRITKVLPLPVANIDGQNVPYRDYLMKYRSSIHFLENKEQVNLKTDDAKAQIQYIKEKSINGALIDAYAKKLAKTLSITVSDSEIDESIKLQRQSSNGEISQQTYEAVVLDYYDWSYDEYRYVTKQNLIRQKVSYTVDEKASRLVDEINLKISAERTSDLSGVYKDGLSDNDLVEYGVSGWVPKNNQDGGLTKTAVGLEKGKVSEVIKSLDGDGYYFVRLLDLSDNQVKYDYIHVMLSQFDFSVDEIIKNNNKTKIYIKI